MQIWESNYDFSKHNFNVYATYPEFDLNGLFRACEAMPTAPIDSKYKQKF